MSQQPQPIERTAADLLDPPISPLCRTLWNAVVIFTIVTLYLERAVGAVWASLGGASVAFVVSLYSRTDKKAAGPLIPNHVLTLSINACIEAFKDAVQESAAQETKERSTIFSWQVNESVDSPDTIGLRIADEGATNCFLFNAKFERQGNYTRACYDYKWEGATPDADTQLEFGRKLAFFITSYESKLGVSNVDTRSWELTLVRIKLALLRALNVRRLSIPWACLCVLLLALIVPTIPHDLASQPPWYVPIVDVEQILTSVGVLLYALDVRKMAVIKLWRALFPLLVLAECTNVIHGVLQAPSAPAWNNASPVEIALSLILVYTAIVLPAFYANYLFAYRRADKS